MLSFSTLHKLHYKNTKTYYYISNTVTYNKNTVEALLHCMPFSSE